MSARPPPEVVSLIEQMEEPTILLSPDYQILAANAAYRARYHPELKPEEHRCFAISHGYNSPCEQNGESCPLQNSLRSGGPSRVTHVHHTPRGPEHCDVITRPMTDGRGKISFLLEIIRPLDTAGTRYDQSMMIGRSPAFNRVVELIERAAPAQVPVLLTGESGTGKELVAQALHRRSRRSRGPFVPLECSGLSAGLFESELFGYEKGAFTGADRRREGLVDAARGGTLFLDELGDVPLPLQVKLLRLIEAGTYRRVGGTEALTADFRLVCATHRDLEDMVRKGEFRQDLYYRINAFPIQLPPLRDRREDIPLLAHALLQRLGANKTLSPAAQDTLTAWFFPGNVRELRNRLERALLLCDGPVLLPEHFPDISGATPTPPRATWPWGEQMIRLEEVERQYLLWARSRSTDRESLARALGLSLRTLYRKLSEAEDQAEG